MKICVHCKKESDETRPYGPGGADVCHFCATSPEHIEETDRNFGVMLDAAAAASPEGVAVISAEDPPSPFTGMNRAERRKHRKGR